MSRGVNSQPGAPALIRATAFTADEGDGMDLRRLLPAWIISGVIHVVLLSLFLLVQLAINPAQAAGTEVAVVENKIEEDYKDKNLTQEDIGSDPDMPNGRMIEKLSEETAPGPIIEGEKVGTLNAPMDANPSTSPAPSGFGDGQGGGVTSTETGSGSFLGITGGAGGLVNQPGGVGGRSGGAKQKGLLNGGNPESEACVARGLGWLIRHQSSDGHWGLSDFHVAGKCNCGNPGQNDEVAGTGFGLLPLLGAGEIHRGSNTTSRYGKEVERALNWLKKKQGADGQLGGGYAHAIAAICLCEAYGMSADPDLRKPAQLAINKIVDWQGPGGGFRYGPKQPGDMSVSAWHIQALKSAEMCGLHVPQGTMKGVKEFLENCASEDGSMYGYTNRQPLSPSSHMRLTAAGLLCRQYTGWTHRNPGLAKGVDVLRKQLPGPRPGDMYYNYYATQVMHHIGAVQPAIWEEWNPRMREALIKNQCPRAGEHQDQFGSWTPEGEFSNGFGRLGYTSLCLLTLEVYYRHLPLYKRELSSAKDEPVRNGT